MEIRPWTTTKPAATDLSHAPAFALAALNIDPPARRISNGLRSEMVEPRVMRVLVALGEPPRRVLSRDDLIELCWDGQVVSDSAITRVVSMLRRVLGDLAGDTVRIETINKVGFRLLADEAPVEAEAVPDADVHPPETPASPPAANAAAPFWRQKWTRRAAVGGIVAAGAGAALIYAEWGLLPGQAPDPRARDLYERGQFLLKTGEIGAGRQAMDFYKQAVRIDPDYADAWGALAVGYIHNLDSPGGGFPQKVAAPELSRSAAERALALDPDQPDAQLALAMPFPHFHRWLEHEKPLRDIVGRYPDYWYGHAQLGLLLSDVGHNEQAVERFRRALEIDPMLPNYWVRLAIALHAAGREQESDIAFDEAFARWPTNLFLRIYRVHLYFDSKRYAEAAAFLRDPRDRHDTAERGRLERRARMADALASGTGFAEHVDSLRAELARAPDLAYHVPFLLAFGAVDLAFDALEATFFGGVVAGRRVAPPAATDQRPTAVLFSPSVLAVRDNPRYAPILQRIGLEDYWRKSGTQPDFRRAEPASST